MRVWKEFSRVDFRELHFSKDGGMDWSLCGWEGKTKQIEPCFEIFPPWSFSQRAAEKLPSPQKKVVFK